MRGVKRGCEPSSEPEAVRARAHRATNRVRFLARKELTRAIADGRLQPGPCEVGMDCKGRIEGHHDDYSLPLKVRWLCKRHHAIADSAKHPKASSCPKCGGPWMQAASGVLYCQRCAAERMRRSRDRRESATKVLRTTENDIAPTAEATGASDVTESISTTYSDD